VPGSPSRSTPATPSRSTPATPRTPPREATPSKPAGPPFLAFTGLEIAGLVTVALILVGVGSAAVVAARRARKPALA
jgi:hypothetical protein